MSLLYGLRSRLGLDYNWQVLFHNKPLYLYYTETSWYEIWERADWPERTFARKPKRKCRRL